MGNFTLRLYNEEGLSKAATAGGRLYLFLDSVPHTLLQNALPASNPFYRTSYLPQPLEGVM